MKETRQLETVLTKDESADAFATLGELTAKREVLDREFADSKARYKASRDALVGEISRLEQIAQTGKELRDVECEALFEHGLVTWIRTDTGEVIDGPRVPQASERQTTLLGGVN